MVYVMLSSPLCRASRRAGSFDRGTGGRGYGARFSMPSVDELAEIKADAEKIKIAHPEHFADKFSTICYGFAG